jgi:hypothetical protein
MDRTSTFARVLQQVRERVCDTDSEEFGSPPPLRRIGSDFDALENFPDFSVEVGGIVRFMVRVGNRQLVPEHDAIHVGNGLLIDFTSNGVRKMPIGRSKYFPLEGKADPSVKQNDALTMVYYRPFDEVLGRYAAEIAFAQAQLAVAPRPDSDELLDAAAEPDPARYLQFNRPKYEGWQDETDEGGQAWSAMMRMAKSKRGQRYADLALSDSFDARCVARSRSFALLALDLWDALFAVCCLLDDALLPRDAKYRVALAQRVAAVLARAAARRRSRG